jgi:hypothetical protein
MRGAIPSLPNTPSWRGAQLKKSTGTALPLPLPLPLYEDQIEFNVCVCVCVCVCVLRKRPIAQEIVNGIR